MVLPVKLFAPPAAVLRRRLRIVLRIVDKSKISNNSQLPELQELMDVIFCG